MKTKLLLLLAMCIGMTSSAWALEKDGDVYQISSAQDLADFAALVNGGETTASAVLTGDIDMSTLESWTAIGDWNTGAVSSAYCGHFDGQGFTIKGFNFTSSHNYYGVFGVVSTGCLIENFDINGTLNLGHKTGGVVGYSRDATPTIRNIHSYLNINCTEASSSAQRPGGILGSAVNGTTIIESCTYSGTLNVGGHTGNIGGIVGYVNNNAAAIVNITNCLFDGEINNGTTADGQCGGIVGFNNGGKATIKNCLSIGTITSSEGNVGQFFGRLSGSNSAFAGKNYYIGEFVYGATSGKKASGTAPVKVTAEQLASGEIAYALNGNQSENANWFQKLGTDKYPTSYGSDIVYLTGHLHCDGTAYEGETAYSNTNASIKDDHEFFEGFCTYCDMFDKSYILTPNGDGIYELGTPNQLKWFAAFVNLGGDNMYANAVLTNDIDMEGVTWPNPIGYWVSDIGYKGHFDGQGYTIKNLKYTTKRNYHGLFGVIWEGAIVENFSISGDVTNADYDAIAPIAYSKNEVSPVYIRNIHSYLNITSSGYDKKIGGILGNGNQGTTYVDHCVFSGTLSSTNKTNCGGIAAYIQNNSFALTHISNCLFEGYLESTESSTYCGGMVGYIGANSNVYTITNCLSVGTFDAPVAGSIFGYVRNGGGGFSNNYYLGSKTSGQTQNTGADNVATSVTTEQLASGEVTAKLGIAFRQNLEDEGESKKDPCPVIPMTDDDLLEHDVVVEITEAGYATLYIPDVDVVADEIKAFTGEINGEKLELIPVKDKTSGVCFIPAQTAVILKGAPGIYSLIPGFGAAKIEGNVLKGSAEDVEATGKYVLAKPEDGEVGFYLASGGTIKAGKAYLELPATEVKAFYFGGEEETAINSLTPALSESEGAIYNMAGQRVSKLQKGINIVNGKKVLK